MTIPRSEYPRPQFVRDSWLNLNGQWAFEIDTGDSGRARGLIDGNLSGKITVPFCPESKLSGVEHVDFMNAVWYSREVEIPADWSGQRVWLHFGAADYDTTVWIAGKEVGRHRGGWTSFSFEITQAVEAGKTVKLVIRCRDYTKGNQPRGKQCHEFESFGCFYTRTTGIWQTVWLEATPMVYLKRPRITPDVAGKRFRIEQDVSNNPVGSTIRVTASFAGEQVAQAETSAETDFAPMLDVVIPDDKVKLWGPGEPNLYDLLIEFLDADGKVIDQATSYAGLRSIAIDGRKVKINGKTVFQRLVLDQGHYPDGILTASSDEALKKDIELAMAVGFNGARLHEKVWEERFLYHADKLGFLVWSEFGDCGFDLDDPPVAMVAEWIDAIRRDFNHPSIIGWCGLCETIAAIEDKLDGMEDLMRAMFLAAKTADPTRPVLDTSGGSHRIAETDVYDHHDYAQDPKDFEGGLDGNLAMLHHPLTGRGGGKAVSLPHAGQPFFFGEMGGTWWDPKAKDDEGWGYGNKPESEEAYYERFELLCNSLLDDPGIFGYCWTQIVDVFQECNGIYYFDRTPKFDAERLRKVQTRQAAIEKLDN